MAHPRKNSKTEQVDFFQIVYHNEERKNKNYSLWQQMSNTENNT